MQANTLTLSVDALNDANPANQEFRRFEETANRTGYAGPDHTLSSRDLLQLYRTFPKRSGESRGNSKCSLKFSTDITVDNASGSGSIVLPLIGEVSFSVPVGATAAQTMELRQRMIAILDDDAISAPLVDILEI